MHHTSIHYIYIINIYNIYIVYHMKPCKIAKKKRGDPKNRSLGVQTGIELSIDVRKTMGPREMWKMKLALTQHSGK